MKTIKIIVEGGVVQNVTIPKEYSKFLNVEVIDYDKINAEEEDKKLEKKFIPDKFIPDDDKEKVNEHKNSQIIQRRGAYWGI